MGIVVRRGESSRKKLSQPVCQCLPCPDTDQDIALDNLGGCVDVAALSFSRWARRARQDSLVEGGLSTDDGSVARCDVTSLQDNDIARFQVLPIDLGELAER